MSDPLWLLRIAAGFFIAGMIVFAYFLGKVLACLESIAKSLRGGGE